MQMPEGCPRMTEEDPQLPDLAGPRDGDRSGFARRAYAASGSTPGPDMGEPEGFALVRRAVDLRSTADVERYLPDILGRALARSWVDRAFSLALLRDPFGLLRAHEVHLPDTIDIRTETTENGRQRVVVYERQPNGTLRRLLYLQLVMMAGR